MIASIVLEMVFLPALLVLMIQIGERQQARRVRRIEAYRQSPESHILHLNDWN